MRTYLKYALALLLVGATLAPIPALAVTGLHSGIKGTVKTTERCNIRINRQKTLCGFLPESVTIVIKNENQSQEVTRVTPDRHGRFRLDLAPGTYWLVPASTDQSQPQFASRQVTVKNRGYLQVKIYLTNSISFHL